jgi:single-strand DNA-binding protein
MIGRLVRDPETRLTKTDKTVTQFSIAVSRPTNKDEADFFPIITWNKLAEACGDNLVKGQRVAVDGRLQVRSFERNDGIKITITEIVAANITFMDKPQNAKTDTTKTTEDLPFL